MANKKEKNSEEAAVIKSSTPFLSKKRIIAITIGLGGMIVGSLVGMGVQMGVQRTGLLGPSLGSLISEQETNFNMVNDQLAAIRAMSDDPEINRSLAQLEGLLERQGQLSQQANAELSYLGGQIAELKQQQLAENGFAGGADFWLKNGESITVGSSGHVFALLSARSGFADVNLNGERQRLRVGDVVPITGDGVNCEVFYKLATPRADDRVGFDLNCSQPG